MCSAKDKNGMTEAEFLRNYDVSKYFRPSVTVDALLVARRATGGRILLVKRGGHPFLGLWAFPGGFVEKDEPCENAAARELFEETGVSDVPLAQLVTASKPDRDPRCRNITVVFYGEVTGEVAAVGGDDAQCAEWFDFACETIGTRMNITLKGGGETLHAALEIKRDTFGQIDLNGTKIIERGGLAFDHAVILGYLCERLACGKNSHS